MSGYKGVGWNKQTKQWRAQIRQGGKQKSLGLFADKRKAAKAWDAAARLHGLTEVNFPRKGETKAPVRNVRSTAQVAAAKAKVAPSA